MFYGMTWNRDSMRGLDQTDIAATPSQVTQAERMDTFEHLPAVSAVEMLQKGMAAREGDRFQMPPDPFGGYNGEHIDTPEEVAAPETRKMYTREEANELGKQIGLRFDRDVPVAEYNYVADKKRAEIKREEVLQYAPNTWSHTGYRFFTNDLWQNIVDPLNVASAFIPFVGQARYLRWVEQMGVPRARLATGAIEGALGNLAVEPLTALNASSLQRDYGVADTFMAGVMGAILGGTLHLGTGWLKDGNRTPPKRMKDPLEGAAPPGEPGKPPGGPTEPPVTPRSGPGEAEAIHASLPPDVQDKALEISVAQMLNDRGPSMDAFLGMFPVADRLQFFKSRFPDQMALLAKNSDALIDRPQARAIVEDYLNAALRRALPDGKVPERLTDRMHALFDIYKAKYGEPLSDYTLHVVPDERAFAAKIHELSSNDRAVPGVGRGIHLKEAKAIVAIAADSDPSVDPRTARSDGLWAVRHEIEHAVDAFEGHDKSNTFYHYDHDDFEGQLAHRMMVDALAAEDQARPAPKQVLMEMEKAPKLGDDTPADFEARFDEHYRDLQKAEAQYEAENLEAAKEAHDEVTRVMDVMSREGQMAEKIFTPEMREWAAKDPTTVEAERQGQQIEGETAVKTIEDVVADIQKEDAAHRQRVQTLSNQVKKVKEEAALEVATAQVEAAVEMRSKVWLDAYLRSRRLRLTPEQIADARAHLAAGDELPVAVDKARGKLAEEYDEDHPRNALEFQQSQIDRAARAIVEGSSLEQALKSVLPEADQKLIFKFTPGERDAINEAISEAAASAQKKLATISRADIALKALELRQRADFRGKTPETGLSLHGFVRDWLKGIRPMASVKGVEIPVEERQLFKDLQAAMPGLVSNKGLPLEQVFDWLVEEGYLGAPKASDPHFADVTLRRGMTVQAILDSIKEAKFSDKYGPSAELETLGIPYDARQAHEAEAMLRDGHKPEDALEAVLVDEVKKDADAMRVIRKESPEVNLDAVDTRGTSSNRENISEDRPIRGGGLTEADQSSKTGESVFGALEGSGGEGRRGLTAADKRKLIEEFTDLERAVGEVLAERSYAEMTDAEVVKLAEDRLKVAYSNPDNARAALEANDKALGKKPTPKPKVEDFPDDPIVRAAIEAREEYENDKLPPDLEAIANAASRHISENVEREKKKNAKSAGADKKAKTPVKQQVAEVVTRDPLLLEGPKHVAEREAIQEAVKQQPDAAPVARAVDDVFTETRKVAAKDEEASPKDVATIADAAEKVQNMEPSDIAEARSKIAEVDPDAAAAFTDHAIAARETAREIAQIVQPSHDVYTPPPGAEAKRGRGRPALDVQVRREKQKRAFELWKSSDNVMEFIESLEQLSRDDLKDFGRKVEVPTSRIRTKDELVTAIAEKFQHDRPYGVLAEEQADRWLEALNTKTSQSLRPISVRVGEGPPVSLHTVTMPPVDTVKPGDPGFADVISTSVPSSSRDELRRRWQNRGVKENAAAFLAWRKKSGGEVKEGLQRDLEIMIGVEKSALEVIEHRKSMTNDRVVRSKLDDQAKAATRRLQAYRWEWAKIQNDPHLNKVQADERAFNQRMEEDWQLASDDPTMDRYRELVTLDPQTKVGYVPLIDIERPKMVRISKFTHEAEVKLSGFATMVVKRSEIKSLDDSNYNDIVYNVTDRLTNKPVAQAILVPDTKGGTIRSVEVAHTYRRQGIASKLYAHIEDDVGIVLRPSDNLMDDGYNFWKSMPGRSMASVENTYRRGVNTLWNSPEHNARDYFRYKEIAERSVGKNKLRAMESAVMARKAAEEQGAIGEVRLVRSVRREAPFSNEQVEVDANGFYSRIAETAKKALGKTFHYDRLVSVMKGSNISKAELDLADLSLAFGGRSSIGRQELLDHLKSAIPDIEVRRVEGTFDSYSAVDHDTGQVRHFQTMRQASEWIAGLDGHGEVIDRYQRPRTRYGVYTINPADPHYREIVIGFSGKEIYLEHHWSDLMKWKGADLGQNAIAHDRETIMPMPGRESERLLLTQERQATWGQAIRDEERKGATASPAELMGRLNDYGQRFYNKLNEANDVLRRVDEIVRSEEEVYEAAKKQNPLTQEPYLPNMREWRRDAISDILSDPDNPGLGGASHLYMTMLTNILERPDLIERAGSSEEAVRGIMNGINDTANAHTMTRAEVQHAELTRDHGVPLHPLADLEVALDISSRQAIRRAVEDGAHWIGNVDADAVMSFGMGGKESGMRRYYDTVYPMKTLHLLQKMDPTIQGVQHIQVTPTHKAWVMPITDKVREAVRAGMPMIGTEGREKPKVSAPDNNAIYYSAHTPEGPEGVIKLVYDNGTMKIGDVAGTKRFMRGDVSGMMHRTMKQDAKLVGTDLVPRDVANMRREHFDHWLRTDPGALLRAGEREAGEVTNGKAFKARMDEAVNAAAEHNPQVGELGGRAIVDETARMLKDNDKTLQDGDILGRVIEAFGNCFMRRR